VDVSHWSELRHVSTNRLLARILHFFRADGLTLVTQSASPIGAGLGGSSALNVAACAALARWSGITIAPEQLLELAMNIECQVIDVPTGVQDYRPAMYGGVSAIELDVTGVRRAALAVDPAAFGERFVLAYTGESRHSGINNWEIMKRHIDGDRDTFELFERIRDTAVALRGALVRSDWEEVGRQLALEWEHRRRLAPGVTTPVIDRVIGAASRQGARAAKVCGAGGGGCVLFFADPDAVPRVRAAIEDQGARLLDCRLDLEGLRLTTKDTKHTK
jgi:D-glycero-alpha-D-manno-heptose-7-phosphate kinase